MKAVFILLVTVASAFAGYDAEYFKKDYEPGFQHVPNGIAAAYRNDLRQEHVNHVAEHVGSGTGTARFVGVPGTGHDFGYNHYDGHAGYPYHHGDFGYQGYGHGYDNGYNNHGYYGGY